MSLSTRVRAAAESQPIPQATKQSFRPDVQGLRAFAVVAVILAHITGWPSGGFVGVDVFFVISGFLITGLLLREYETTGRISFSDFYKRRVKRILPASVLVLVATTLAAMALLPKTRADSTVVDAVWSLFFAGNWRFAATGTDYFQEGIAASPLQHFWSLAVEEQFYFVWPLLMLGGFWVSLRAGSRGSGRVTVGVVMVIVSVASMAWAIWETAGNPTVAYFSTLSRAWELGIGALLAVAAPLLSRIPGYLRTALAWTGIAGLLVAVATISPESAFPAPWAILPVASAALIIAAGTGGGAKFLAPLTNPVSRYIGDISYSLYLWHWPVMTLLVAVMESGTVLFYVYAVVLSVALSIASYHYVEDPIRSLGTSKRHGHKSSKGGVRISNAAGLVSLALIAVLGVGAIAMIDASRKSDAVYVAAEPGAGPVEACFGAELLDPNSACDRNAAPAVLVPSIDRMAEDEGVSYRCWSPEGVGESMKSCAYRSDREDSLNVAIVGDSHAASLIPALITDMDETNWNLDTFVGNGCRWQTIPVDAKNCGAAMQEIQAALVGGDYDIVVTTASRANGGSNEDQAIRESVEAWQPVIDTGAKVVVVADVPAVDASALECLTRVGYDPATSDCSTLADVAFAKPDMKVAAAESVPGVAVVDMSDMLCMDGKCPVVIGGSVVYRDGAGHLTATYAASLAPYLNQRILEAASAG